MFISRQSVCQRLQRATRTMGALGGGAREEQGIGRAGMEEKRGKEDELTFTETGRLNGAEQEAHNGRLVRRTVGFVDGHDSFVFDGT